MNTNNFIHEDLVATYIFNDFLYSLSLQDRIAMDLGYTEYNINLYSKEVAVLSDKEIMDKINKLKVPLWNNVYEKIHKKRLLLFVLLIPFVIKEIILYPIRSLSNFFRQEK